ncbi:MAG: hypothetical protein M1820_004728 [Bogoriella megaspora]|nr:MAG: hypothetical protein M1820_004728 [Bogoriella megaspora]
MSSPTLPLIKDPRMKAGNFANLNGRRYHYILGLPTVPVRATIFLVHGWPDLSIGWRYQIPLLVSQGLRVVALDMMGYGLTESPECPPESLHLYGFRRAADDIATLASQLQPPAPRIILGGHDWGGAVVYRVAQWHPHLVSALFSVCTPPPPLGDRFMSTEEVAKRAPNFGYQLHLASGDIERRVRSKDELRGFLNAMFGGKPPKGEVPFSPEKGLNLETMQKCGKSRLIGDEELDYYADQYARNGLHGPCNWYRTRKANFEDEKNLDRPATIKCPVLFILASKDNVLTRSVAQGIEKTIPNLTQREVDAGHWALWQATEQVNTHVIEWLDSAVFGGKSSL